MLDKYGAGQDPYCYPGSGTLRNRLGIKNEKVLAEAETELTHIAAAEIEFSPPPYDLEYLKKIHSALFAHLYEWAGEIRHVDISKDTTHFCTAVRIEPEAKKLFASFAQANWFIGLERIQLLNKVAQLFGDLNVVHPFREGNGRAQRIMFEHIIVNLGYEISWWAIDPGEWTQANIDAVVCDYRGLMQIFDRCIGPPIAG